MSAKKIIVALVLLPFFIALIGWGKPWMLLVVALVLGAGLGGWESAKIAFGDNDRSFQYLSILLSMVLCLASSTGNEMNIVIALIGSFFVAFLLAGLVSADLSQALPRTAKTMFVAIYPGLLMGYLVALKSYEPIANGCKLVMVLFALVWINDAGAYFAGNFFGKRKLAPRISPNKTWEGAIGGFSAAVILGALIGMFSPFYNFQQGLILGVVLGVVGPLGDLVESAIKRGAGVKDSGTLLPGHGGILDRIDSVIACAPILYYYTVLAHHAELFRNLGVSP